MSEAVDALPINTYHCLCTTLVLATAYSLASLSTRKESTDGAYILPGLEASQQPGVSPSSALHNVAIERKAVIIKRDDGFEKRWPLRCNRCDLIIGYKLDEAHFDGSQTQAESVVYLLPGSMVDTNDMKNGKELEQPVRTRPV